MLTVMLWISAIAAGIAAAFWLLSAGVRVPDLIQFGTPAPKASGTPAPKATSKPVRLQSMASAIAAVFAAVSAIAQVMTIYLATQSEVASHTHTLVSKHNGYHYYSHF
jgi:hypothetical protein